ncbi:MAG TPA: RidA family protein [Hyphomicrobiaceae bacterium]|nr:RidA family protein [Hyphomicrobiaceae bacterium]
MSNAKVSRLNPPSAGPVFGMYSHVSIVEPGTRTAYIAGQVAVDRAGLIVGPNDLAAQVPVVFANLEGILADLRASFDDVIELRTYVVGRENLDAWFKARTAVYTRLYPNGKWPPNTLVIVSALNRPELRLEISATVALGA